MPHKGLCQLTSSCHPVISPHCMSMFSSHIRLVFTTQRSHGWPHLSAFDDSLLSPWMELALFSAWNLVTPFSRSDSNILPLGKLFSPSSPSSQNHMLNPVILMNFCMYICYSTAFFHIYDFLKHVVYLFIHFITQKLLETLPNFPRPEAVSVTRACSVTLV